MCKFLIKNFYNKKYNSIIRQQIDKISTGSGVFVKWYDVKTHHIRYTPGILVAKRGKGESSHILIRRKITKEVLTTQFYIYARTFLGIGILKKERNNLNAKKYNFLLRPIKWKYL
jgi:ribosomal protein L19